MTYPKIRILSKFISPTSTLISRRWTLVLGSSILKLLSCKNKSYLFWWNSFLILDLGLDIIDYVALLNIKSDCLSSQSLDEDLYSSASIDLPAEKKYLSQAMKENKTPSEVIRRTAAQCVGVNKLEVNSHSLDKSRGAIKL